MLQKPRSHQFEDIEFRIIYSRRRTLGISILPDSTVIVRAPAMASLKTITRIVEQKADWIKKHRDNYRDRDDKKLSVSYVPGETHLFRGTGYILNVKRSNRSFIRFSENTIECGLDKHEEQLAVRKLLYTGYKREAMRIFPEIFGLVLKKHENQNFRPAQLVIRSMKRRWGSCSKKGIITLSTELIKLPDIFIEYVITHELCHLKHHNHGKEYYKLLTELFPAWKQARMDMRGYIQ